MWTLLHTQALRDRKGEGVCVCDRETYKVICLVFHQQVQAEHLTRAEELWQRCSYLAENQPRIAHIMQQQQPSAIKTIKCFRHGWHWHSVRAVFESQANICLRFKTIVLERSWRGQPKEFIFSVLFYSDSPHWQICHYSPPLLQGDVNYPKINNLFIHTNNSLVLSHNIF